MRRLVLVLLLGLARAAHAAASGTAESVVGTWELVLVDNVMPDGTRVHLYGERPQGLLVFGADGRYTLQIFADGRPRFAGNDKAKATAEEYRAAVVGANAHYGRWAVAPDGRLVFSIERASFPNWEGTEQKRAFAIESGELRYTVPAPTTGAGATGEVVWRRAPAGAGAAAGSKGDAKTMRAAGTFEVKMVPQQAEASVGDPTIGRMALDKVFAGDLAGVSRGQMLATMTAVEGSAGYVALERFDGTLSGRKGAFALQHDGRMDRGKPSLTITIVPDSGTGALEGIAGAMSIEVDGKIHRYVLEYTLPGPTR
jgi:hypothetical protein